MTQRYRNIGAGRGGGLWPVLGVLLAAVLVPTACVLWFMNAAMRNERLAVREKLTRAYTRLLDDAQGSIDRYWDARRGELNAQEGEGPGETFARLARSGAAYGSFVFDERGGLAYPNEAAVMPNPPAGPASRSTTRPTTRPTTEPFPDEFDWAEADRLEFELNAPADAARLYARIAERHPEGTMAARAILAQARCLAKSGRKGPAIELLTKRLAERKYTRALDRHGRQILPNARLLGLELIGDGADPRFVAVAGELIEQVNDYADLSVPAAQRLFLMTRLEEIVPDRPAMPTLAAERETARRLDALPNWDRKRVTVQRLTSAGIGRARVIENVNCSLLSADKRVRGLYRGRRVVAEVERLATQSVGAADVSLRLQSSVLPKLPEPFISTVASPRHMSDWRICLYLRGRNPFAVAAGRQNTVYLWIACLTIAVIAVLALLVGRYIGRQVKLTRLKNDFLATVSHELKTPLASMRVLVDTLLEGRCEGPRQVQEYFVLIARENERLSRLIDNFLTFSRMERNKRAFEFDEVNVNEAVAAAAEALGERFDRQKCSLEVEAAGNLPPVSADRDALVTVILNLLDNAWKYSGDEKRIKLRTYSTDDGVCIEVSDNGIGMSRRAAKRIFNRFYQVDQTLSRGAGGCGLGLSIVKFILDAHAGGIDVSSRPGQGSTFTVSLPAIAGAEPYGGNARSGG